MGFWLVAWKNTDTACWLFPRFQAFGIGGGEGVSHSFPVCTFLSFLFFKALAHQFHYLGQDQSTMAQQAEMTVAKCSLMSCVCVYESVFLLGPRTMR